ncbi:hypothetical protein F5882DRAFT_293430, partial [Hyaloscypha sp. PMI_1271]
LPEEQKDRIVRDIQRFTEYRTREHYFQSGILYRRGYLFYGARGTGKTSFYKASAMFFQLRIYLVNVAELGLSDNSLLKPFIRIPRRCMLVLDDINPTQLKGNSKSSKKMVISVSGLQSAIDGPLTSDQGHLFVLTSNFHRKWMRWTR